MKTMDFSETFAAIDQKIGRSRQLIELMSIQGHFLTLAQGHLHMKSDTSFLRNHWANFNQILYVSFKVHENEKGGRHAHI